MAKKLKPEPKDPLDDYVLTDTLFTAIGKILRTAAEIEHEISIALFHHAKISPDIGFLLIGQMSVRSKVERLFNILEVHQLKFSRDEDKKNLTDSFALFFKLRNSLAHGILVGMHPQTKHIVFATNQYEYRTDTTLVLSGESYTEDQITSGVVFAEHILSNLRKTFGAPPWPDRRNLLTHPRLRGSTDTPPINSHSAPQKRPPRPSREPPQ